LDHGQLVQFGTPYQLVRQPINDFVRLFLGEDAFLRQLAGVQAGTLARVGRSSGLPVISSRLDARSVLSFMLREKARAVAVQDESGVVLGVVDWDSFEVKP
ncbi:MAG: ABC transporter ATP-binding protein, partial [Deinococcales bacterium]